MDDGLAAAFDPHTQLKEGERGDGRKVGDRGQACGGEPAQDFPNSDRAMTTGVLVRGKKGDTAEVREDRWKGSAHSQ